ncbi:DEKNAAC102237 [Brettanomyces naardenensis]|uniref:DEKNAAC102237 n=1 Tax=Brettanomyces naardenensis TaxID=13370 RepID=A0A448YL26_BRENA|nr:DEKNAAC102237 [Brettanomyces naardenensis]
MSSQTNQARLRRKLSSLSRPEKRGRKKDALEKFIESDQTVIVSSLNQLRYNVLCEGIKHGEDGVCPYRVYVWSILLRAEPVETDYYIHLLERGKSNSFDKIFNDSFRTFKKDQRFAKKVSNSTLIRVLNSYALEIEESPDARISPYVQGMNILVAPFAYVCKSEPEAFALFSRLLVKYIPTYVTPNLSGVMNGVKLVDIILELVDPKLYNHLKSRMLTAKIYALPSVLTLSACTPPFTEVLELWDFLFSYGVHLNIFFIIAQIILIRKELLNSKNPMMLLRQFPDLDAKKVIKLSLSFVKIIPEELYDLIVKHPVDDSVTDMINNYDS